MTIEKSSTMVMNKPVSKTVHTPVFYATPQPSASSSSSNSTYAPVSYLDSLSRKHIALAQMVEELPGDDEDPASRERAELLQKQVIGAFKLAKGEPADGKWTAVAQLLRLRVTRGRSHWLGLSREGRAIVSSTGWINAGTESEWKEWERKWVEEDKVKRKVESWKQKLETRPLSPSIISISDDSEEGESGKGKTRTKNDDATAKKVSAKATELMLSTPRRDLRDPPALGFKVMKRSSLALNGKPNYPARLLDDDASKARQNVESKETDIKGRTRDIPETNLSGPNDKPEKQNIADVSETSFLPPSFPSQLQTSTPNDKADRRRKPPLIPPVSTSSPLPQSPNAHVYGFLKTRIEATSSPPDLPTTLTKGVEHTIDIAHGKRQRSLTPESSVKRARTSLPLPNTSSTGPPTSPHPVATDDPTSSPMIITPKRHGRLPTLKELLASSKIAKQSPLKRMGTSPLTIVRKGKERETTINQMVSKEEEKVNDAHEPNPRLPFRDSLLADDPFIAGYGYGAPSPTKSLSSLAESDSGSEEDGVNTNIIHDFNDDFNPPFASTQAQDKDVGLGLGTLKEGSGFGWAGYSSQFDMNGKIDQVSKFMEKDVDYDWLGDPAPEIEETQW